MEEVEYVLTWQDEDSFIERSVTVTDPSKLQEELSKARWRAEQARVEVYETTPDKYIRKKMLKQKKK